MRFRTLVRDAELNLLKLSFDKEELMTAGANHCIELIPFTIQVHFLTMRKKQF